MDHHVLLDPSHRVPSVPDAPTGVAWLRSHVARFSEGEAHRRRRQLAEDLLRDVPLESLRRPGDPVATLAAALGLPRSVTTDISLIAAAYQPHTPVPPAADRAVERLVQVCGTRDERTAAQIGLLVQACGATRALLAGQQPPVPTTRRVAPTGEEVKVDLTGAPFGAGAHACPGQEHALALVDGARAFHRLHDGPTPLILPNAWDLASALAFVEAGFAAVGTTSLGIAATNGLPDAQGLSRKPTLELAERIAHLPVPVTIDIEAGLGGDVGELGRTLSEMGIAGVNIEDGRGDRLASPYEQARLIGELRDAAPHLFINARVDTHWLGVDREQTVDRARRYVDAGADGIFVAGLEDPREIERVASAVPVPLNVLAHGDPTALAELGVRRISTGSLPFRSALHTAVATAVAVRDGGSVPPADSYAEVEARTARWSGGPGLRRLP